jgi:hypothetical protein
MGNIQSPNPNKFRRQVSGSGSELDLSTPVHQLFADDYLLSCLLGALGRNQALSIFVYGLIFATIIPVTSPMSV